MVAPFEADGSALIVRPDVVRELPLEPPTLTPAMLTARHDREEYDRQFALVIEALRELHLSKLVLARRAEVTFDGADPGQLFMAACRKYPSLFVALVDFGPDGDKWLFVTPELLAADRSDGHFDTAAVAGTMTAQEWAHRKPWSDKNVAEQRLVADWMRQRLAPIAAHISAEQRTLAAGVVVHRATLFTFRPAAGTSLLDVARRLHPTPATAGLPVDKAVQSIARIERRPRAYYSGYLGPLGLDASRLYVGLRALQLSPDCTSGRLYAGGGILPESQPDDEWQETANKMLTITSLFAPR